ncbi:hypothetical protein [Pseudaestuariivita atlantica]|uniref:hypothetical protein n=1 Tax=Pseudaestuariivita atlantica TaxID=1317121 RepID=UPI00106D7513|nr:hypothetical protein [Pseudaestuariivita atlantica]
MRRSAILAAVLTIAFSCPAVSETVLTEAGGDTFAAGETLVRTLDADRDVFAAGRSTTVLGETQGDLHVSGFDVKMSADVVEDAYAAGATVTISGSVDKDLSVAGFTVRLEPSARVGENARLMAATLNIEAPIAGSLAATGRDVYLNAAVTGDARIFAKSLRFGPDARVDGQLIYSTEDKLDVPTTVASPDRVRFEQVDTGRVWDELDNIREMPILPTMASMLFGFLITLLFFVVLGAIALGFFPKRLETMRMSVSDAFGQTAILGVVGLSLLFGAVPVVALTIVGLPLVPIILLLIVATWTLSYALGAYAIATRLWFGLGGDADPGMLIRLVILAAAIVAIALLNFIPFVGWVVNYTLVLLGLGAITRLVFGAMVGSPEPALDVDMRETEAS